MTGATDKIEALPTGGPLGADIRDVDLHDIIPFFISYLASKMRHADVHGSETTSPADRVRRPRAECPNYLRRSRAVSRTIRTSRRNGGSSSAERRTT